MESYFWFALFTAMNGLLVLLLALHVSRLRIVKRIAYGDGDDVDMNQAIRAHANALEHIILFALLVLSLSFMALDNSWLAGLVIVFTASRVIHAYGMVGRAFRARQLGAAITYLAELAAIVLLFIRLFSA